MVQKEKEGEWVKIPDESNVWKPEQPGDEVEGKYLKKESAPYKGRPNCKYILEPKEADTEEDNVTVYGTVGLRRKMEKIPKGYMVKIVYLGEKPSSDPVKKPFKLFDVFAWMSKEDPVYKRLYPDGEVKTNTSPTLAGNDDPEALTMIGHYGAVIRDSKGKNHHPTAWEVINLAEAEELDADDMTRIKVQLAELIKQGKIDEGKEEA